MSSMPSAIVGDLLDGDHGDPVLLREQLEVREPSRRAVVVQHLADHRDRREPREARQVDRRLGVATAIEHAAVARAQREDVAGTDEVLRPRRRVEHPADRRARDRRRRCREPASRWSIVTVNAVSHPPAPRGTIGPISSLSSHVPSHGMHTRPRAQRNMKLSASPVTQSAAIWRSPSFSRSSSSTTSTISPRRIRRSASSMGVKDTVNLFR